MSDTEREAFGAWFRRQYDRDLVSKFEIAERAYIEGRRSTTTEARAPLSDAEIDRFARAYVAGFGHFNDENRALIRDGVRKSIDTILAARAPAPPSVPPARKMPADTRDIIEALKQEYGTLKKRGQSSYWDFERHAFVGRAIALLGVALAGPPAPSVPSDAQLSAATKALADGVELALGGHPTEAKASAVQRPAGGDDA